MYLENHNFSPKLSDIFHPVEKNAIPTINYKALPCEVDDEYVVDFRVLSVNGCRSLHEFRELSSDILTTFLEEVGKAMRYVPKRFRSKVSEEITDKYTDIMELLVFEKVNTTDDYHSFREEPMPIDACFLFTMANFSGGDYHDKSAIYMDQILHAASDFSYILWDVMAKAFEKLNMLLTAIEFLPELKVLPGEEENHMGKLKWQLTVPQLAGFFKILVDSNLLEVKNKSEFCRSIADLFQSSGNDNLSWRSFKNHFDSPSPDAIRFCQEEFLNLNQIAARFFEDES